jgi:chloramphenicol 3-O phosphotransferase
MQQKLILVVGTSSAGKTTLCRALQEAMPEHWAYMSLDIFFQMVNPRYGGGLNGPLSQEGFAYKDKGTNTQITYGPTGEKFLRGMVAAVEAMIEQDNPVIFDDMLLSDSHAALWDTVVKRRRALVIRAEAPVAVLFEREQLRGNPKGLAISHLATNAGLTADIVIDTHLLPLVDQVRQISRYVEKRD